MFGPNMSVPGQGWELIERQTASNSTALDFTKGIDGGYDAYCFVLSSILPANDGEALVCRISDDGGSSYEADATDYETNISVQRSDGAGLSGNTNSQGTTKMYVTNGQSNVAGDGASGFWYCFNPDATENHVFFGDTVFMDNSATAVLARMLAVGVHNGSTAAINAIRFLMNGGNIASGEIALYGLKR